MSTAQELFRFFTVRRPERLMAHRIESRLIRDPRRNGAGSVLDDMLGRKSFDVRFENAQDFRGSTRYLPADDPLMLASDRAAELLRNHLVPGITLEAMADLVRTKLPGFVALLSSQPPAEVVQQIVRLNGRLWDSLYAEVALGSAVFTRTNHLADGIRVQHVFRLLWVSAFRQLETWQGLEFDQYDLIIDTSTTRVGDDRKDTPADGPVAGPVGPTTPGTVLDPQPGLPANVGGVADVPTARSTAVVTTGAAATMAARALTRFDVALEVGEIRPPVVGDLLLVEQDLLRYEMREIAEIENILAREQKERSVRTLSRVTETSSTESEEERETSESRTVDERFSLSSESQKAADQSFSASVGVSASGKFGPMQVSATANASFSTSKSSSEATAEEFAREITEEATQRVRTSIKESSSLTILTENQQTALHGFNNTESDQHVIGIYRWVDKIYEARTMNYGRRLMLDLSVPEPAAFFRGLLTKSEVEGQVEIPEPLHPAQISTSSFLPLSAPGSGGFQSFADVDTENYGRLAALYDVTDIAPPPLEKITGTKTVVYPESDTAKVVKDHSDEVNELSYVWADTSLPLDPDYQLARVGVWAPKGKSDALGWYADVLKLGTKSNKYNLLTVLVANKSFYFYAEGPDDNRTITTNFNTTEEIGDTELFSGNVTPAIPILFAADFEGIVNFTVIYTAFLREEALDRWKQSVYAAVLKGYERKRREYDEAVATADAKVEAEIEERTYQLRDSQYREIELTEIKRCSIDLLTQGTATGRWSVGIDSDGDVTVYYDEDDAQPYWTDWRTPLANGTVATFFENAFEWENTNYTFDPYYWTDDNRWRDLLEVTSADPTFEAFLRAGQARVVLPVRPGYERSVHYFLKTGLVWGGGYLPLFQNADMLETYDDVENHALIDPPEQVGDAWELRVPTSLVILQDGSELPVFETDEDPDDASDGSGDAQLDPGDAPF